MLANGLTVIAFKSAVLLSGSVASVSSSVKRKEYLSYWIFIRLNGNNVCKAERMVPGTEAAWNCLYCS